MSPPNFKTFTLHGRVAQLAVITIPVPLYRELAPVVGSAA